MRRPKGYALDDPNRVGTLYGLTAEQVARVTALAQDQPDNTFLLDVLGLLLDKAPEDT